MVFPVEFFHHLVGKTSLAVNQVYMLMHPLTFFVRVDYEVLKGRHILSSL